MIGIYVAPTSRQELQAETVVDIFEISSTGSSDSKNKTFARCKIESFIDPNDEYQDITGIYSASPQA